MCFKNSYFLSFFFLLLPALAFSNPQQTDSLLNPHGDTAKQETEIFDYSESGFFDRSSETFDLQAEVRQQKAYKFLFLAAATFFALLAVLVFLFFYKKINRVHEMTKINLREIQLRDTRIKNLSLLLSYSSQPMLLMNRKGNILWMNSAFAKYGYFSEDEKPEEKNFFEDIIGDGAEKEALFSARETGQSKTIDIFQKGKNIKRSLIPVSESDGSLSGFALIDYWK